MPEIAYPTLDELTVRDSRAPIDARFAEVWRTPTRISPEMRVCAFPDSVSDEVWIYAQSLGELLGARISRVATVGELDALDKSGCAECDLVIFEQPDHPLVRQLLRRPSSGRARAPQQGQIPFAVLSVRRPRWPLKRILLVVCGEGADEAAMEWVLRLARQSGSAVTALTVVPPVPIMYGRLAGPDQGLPELLNTDTVLGRQMRQVVRHLVDCGIKGTLRLRQGIPERQVCQEAIEGEYDLIAMAASPCQRWQRWLEGDLIDALLRQVKRPVLVAKSTTA